MPSPVTPPRARTARAQHDEIRAEVQAVHLLSGHAAMADLSPDAVGPDAAPLERGGLRKGERRLGQEPLRLGLHGQQRLHLASQLEVLAAGLVEERSHGLGPRCQRAASDMNLSREDSTPWSNGDPLVPADETAYGVPAGQAWYCS